VLPGGRKGLISTACITFYIHFGIMGIRGRWLNDGSFIERRAAMNNFYLYERLAELKMQEAQREAEQARLLKEAGLSGSSLLARAADALRDLLQARNHWLQGHRSLEH
jgi:hypothetical protein